MPSRLVPSALRRVSQPGRCPQAAGTVPVGPRSPRVTVPVTCRRHGAPGIRFRSDVLQPPLPPEPCGGTRGTLGSPAACCPPVRLSVPVLSCGPCPGAHLPWGRAPSVQSHVQGTAGTSWTSTPRPTRWLTVGVQGSPDSPPCPQNCRGLAEPPSVTQVTPVSIPTSATMWALASSATPAPMPPASSAHAAPQGGACPRCGAGMGAPFGDPPGHSRAGLSPQPLLGHRHVHHRRALPAPPAPRRPEPAAAARPPAGQRLRPPAAPSSPPCWGGEPPARLRGARRRSCPDWYSFGGASSKPGRVWGSQKPSAPCHPQKQGDALGRVSVGAAGLSTPSPQSPPRRRPAEDDHWRQGGDGLHQGHPDEWHHPATRAGPAREPPAPRSPSSPSDTRHFFLSCSLGPAPPRRPTCPLPTAR